MLSASQFERCIERERSLADRGTRRFSVLALCWPVGEPLQRRGREALAEFARRLCKCLRSTDLVGRQDARRVEVLLTDTELEQAQAVGRWIEHVGTDLGLALEQTIYVYPSVTEHGPDRVRASSPHNGGGPAGAPASGNGAPARSAPAVRPHRAPIGGGEAAAKWKGVDAGSNARAWRAPLADAARTERLGAGRRWPTEDLWPRLGVPTPWWKRAQDVLFAAVMLLVLSPLFLLVAIAIKLDSAGPVIFRQRRAGRGARPFVFYKFRSMIVDAEQKRASLAEQNEQSGPVFKIREDPRITRVGRLLRRWSIDELPQLWNVLKGDISLVGPRPPTLDEVSKYERWQRRRLSVTGGLTCTWQVSGRSQIPFRDWMRLDMRYVMSRSPWLDLRLLMRTLPAVISGRGAS